MRTALLPSAGDPFLLAYWLRHYETWADQVDELRVLVNGQRIPEVAEYMQRLIAAAPHAVMEYQPDRLDHGKGIRVLLEQTSADLVVLCEEDAFVREPAAIGRAFARIEAGETDIVACPRGSVSDEIRDAAFHRFGAPPPVRSHEWGNSMWPCWWFGRRSDLLATDRNFSGHSFPAGVPIPELSYTPVEEGSGDTFVHTTYQLLDKGLRVHWEAEYRADRAEMDWWRDGAPWFHVGSLSAGYGYVFCREASGYPDSFDRIAISAQDCRPDWEKRMSWWQRITADDVPELADHLAQYRDELARFTEQAKLDRPNIAWWSRVFDGWITWADTAAAA